MAHDREPRGERLQHHERIGLVRTGQREHVGCCEEQRQVGAGADEQHALGDIELGRPGLRCLNGLSVAADDEKHHGGRVDERLDRVVQTLAGELVAHEQDDASVVVELEGGTCSCRSSSPGGRNVVRSTPLGITTIRRSHLAVHLTEGVRFGCGEHHDRAVDAGAVADRGPARK